MEWFSLLIPILAAFGLARIFRHKLVWWELVLPFAATALMILSVDKITESVVTDDTEFRGSVIVKAQHYEEWSTWRKRTCYHTYTTGSGKNRTTHRVPYDCSYCDDHPAQWFAIDGYGNSYTISKSYYEKLKQRWNAIPRFVELDRSIRERGSCGVDGDLYEIFWNRRIETSEAAVWRVSYENRVQASKSAFKMRTISDSTAIKLGLHRYPEFNEYYRQKPILGYRGPNAEINQRRYEYFNGYHGQKHHVKLFLIYFYNRSIDISFDQEAYWDGGNRNELVVCVGVDSTTGRKDWVRAFGWSDVKRTFVDVREDLMDEPSSEPIAFYGALDKAAAEWKPKDFHDFDYLNVDIPFGILVLIWILSIIITIGASLWAIKNDIE